MWLRCLTLMCGMMVGAEAQGQSARKDASQGDVIIVTLRAAASVPDPHVYIEDVAQLEGGNFAQRQLIAKLDLTELPLSDVAAPIPREQIYFRIRLAGMESGFFRIQG